MPEKTLALAYLHQQVGEYILPALLGLIGGIIRIIQKDGPCTWFGRLAALANSRLHRNSVLSAYGGGRCARCVRGPYHYYRRVHWTASLGYPFG